MSQVPALPSMAEASSAGRVRTWQLLPLSIVVAAEPLQQWMLFAFPHQVHPRIERNAQEETLALR